MEANQSISELEFTKQFGTKLTFGEIDVIVIKWKDVAKYYGGIEIKNIKLIFLEPLMNFSF